MCTFGVALRLVSTVAIFAISAIQLFAQIPDKLPETKRTHQFTLPNGMRCIIAQNPKPERRAEIRLVVNVGSLMEDGDQRGVAHVLEHLAFNGSKRFPGQAMIKYLEGRGMSFGAHTNAYTTSDETVYQLQIPTDSASVMATALDIVADWAFSLTLDSASIENERKIVTEEWRSRELGVQGRITKSIYGAVLENSRYADRIPIGTKTSLENFKHDAVRRFYRDWYVPENMTVVIVGDIQPDSLEHRIRQHLAVVPARTSKRNVTRERASMSLFPKEIGKEAHALVFIDKELPSIICGTMWRHPWQPTKTVSVYRENIVRTMALMLTNSRFQDRVLASTKPPFRSAAVTWNMSNRTIATASLLIEPKDSLLASYEAALAELYRIRRDGFLLSEIRRAQATMQKNIRTAYNERANMTSAAFAQATVYHALTGSTLLLSEEGYTLDSSIIATVQPENLRLVVANLFALGSGAQYSFVAVPPQDSAGITRETLTTTLNRAAASNLPPYTEDTLRKSLLVSIPQSAELVRERTYPLTEITEWQLSNGIRVFLKPTTFKNDQILLQSYVAGGLSLASEEQYPTALRAAFLQAPSIAGIASLTPSELGKIMTGKSVAVRPYIQQLYHGINASSSVNDLETMLQVFYSAHTAPRLDSASIMTAKERERQSFSLRHNYPAAHMQDTISTVMFGNHYTARSITKDELERWNHAAVGFPFYQELFENMRNGTVVVVGAFDVQRIKPLILRYCGALPTKVVPTRFRDIGTKPRQGQFEVLVREGKDKQSATTVLYHDTVQTWTFNRDLAFDVARSIGDTKLRETLRNDAGGVYASSVNITYSSQPTPGISSVASFSSEPDRAEELYKRMNALWKRLGEDGITIQDVQEAKNKLLKSREVSNKENSAWLGRIIFWTQIGESPERMIEYNEIMERLTLDDIRKAFRKAFLTSNYGRFVLLPEAK